MKKMTDTKVFSEQVLKKLDAAKDLAHSRQMTHPITITINDADGRPVFHREFHSDDPQTGITLGDMNGRLPVSATIADATGKTTVV